MANLFRVRTLFSNSIAVGGGVNTMFFDASHGQAVGPAVTASAAFWEAMKYFIVGSAGDIQNSPIVDEIDDATGTLITSHIASVSTHTPTGASPALPLQCQALCVLQTGVVVAGRRLRGRINVPRLTNAAASSSVMTGSVVTSINTALATLTSDAASDLVVWARPFPGSPAVGTRPARPARTGTSAVVTSGACDTRVATLRSRNQ